jgi:RES domain-containing protein
LIHDTDLVRKLESLPTSAFKGTVFRATRAGQDPLAPSIQGGRWAPPKDVSVLYTSLEREGAIAEVVYHWSLLTPLPSKPMVVHQVAASAQKSLRLIEAQLPDLGVDMASYKSLNYRRTQEIGAAVDFLGCDGLMVPSARWNSENVVLFMNQHDIAADTLRLMVSEPVDWRFWGRQHGFLEDLA